MNSNLKRMWINQPSTLQPLHSLHGTRVLADFSESGRSDEATIYFLDGSTISQQAAKNALSEGWGRTGALAPAQVSNPARIYGYAWASDGKAYMSGDARGLGEGGAFVEARVYANN